MFIRILKKLRKDFFFVNVTQTHMPDRFIYIHKICRADHWDRNSWNFTCSNRVELILKLVRAQHVLLIIMDSFKEFSSTFGWPDMHQCEEFLRRNAKRDIDMNTSRRRHCRRRCCCRRRSHRNILDEEKWGDREIIEVARRRSQGVL